MDREISKEVRQKEQRKQFIKLGAGIGIAVVLIGGVIGFMQTSLQRKDLVFSTVDKGVIEVSVARQARWFLLSRKSSTHRSTPVSSRFIKREAIPWM